MLRVEFGESIVGILEAQERAEKTADKRVQEWQIHIKERDCFIQIASDGLEIFGEVLGPGSSKNWRLCRCYSFACPEGEMGYVHVSQINTLINRKNFEMRRDNLGKAYKLAIKELKDKGFCFV
jgi:hypothetical protein